MNTFTHANYYYSLPVALTCSQKWNHALLLCSLLLSHNTMKSLFRIHDLILVSSVTEF